MGNRLQAHEYSIKALRRIIAEQAKSSEDVISGKLHHNYFEGYCKDIDVKTIVVETDYIDHDYLEDYSAYYVRCFSDYSRKCSRLHFFNTKFTSPNLDAFLEGTKDCPISQKLLQDHYLGFVVIKPLPQTVIGRTCLKTYPKDGRRYYPITRNYPVNLCGINLIVKTLAFQEQDKVVAACATSALWSVFQATGKQFQHPIPSPVEITRAATERLAIETRVLPSRGLSTAMMAHAIRNVDLEPFLIRVSDAHVLKSTIYSYLRGGIPMILGIELWDTSGAQHESMGFHAVAVTGYSLGAAAIKPIGRTQFSLKASKIDKLYVHDDQIGPFARMEFDDKPITLEMDATGGMTTANSLSTSWVGKNKEPNSVRALPAVLLIPLYNKIRIPFGVIDAVIISFDSFIESFRDSLAVPFPERLEWDIYLTTNNKFKKELLNSPDATGEYTRSALLECMPRFIWRATAYIHDEKKIDLIFDATDIEQGPFFVRAFEYDEEISLFLRIVSKLKKVEKKYSTTIEWKIIEWFKNQSLPDLDDINDSK